MPNNPDKCQKNVSDSSGWHFYQCSKPVKVNREGKNYCTIHDPEKIKAKNEENSKKWQDELQNRRIEHEYFEEMKNNYPQQKNEIERLTAENKRLRSALEEITRGDGAFSLDPLKHAENCINNMKFIAKQALAQGGEK